MAWSFIGRNEELGELFRLLGDGTSRGVVLAGPSGVGKSRLAAEFLRRAGRQDVVTAHITASRSTARMPFGAVASLLPAGDYPEGAGESRAAMLRDAAAALVRDAGDRRLVLLVDDAHLLDDASATLVYQLVATGTTFVVATVRSTEPAPTPVVALWKDDLMERVDVPGLGREAIEGLLCMQLGGQVDSFVVSHLSDHCRGNVLFLRELVIGAVRDHSLVDDCGIWRLVGPLSPSDRLVELVEARLGGLRPAERAVLELVCWGEPLETSELATLADLEVAEQLEAGGYLSTRQEGGRWEVRPAHPVYGDVVRARTPALRIPRLVTALADTVEQRGLEHPRDVLRVATWRLDGGGGTPEVMLAAAQTARWSYDFALSARLVDRAIAVGAGFDAMLLAAEVATLQGRVAEGREQLAKLVVQATDDREKSLVALARLNNHAFYGGAIDEGLQIVADAERAIGGQVWLEEIRARQAGLLLAQSGPVSAARTFEPLLGVGNERALVWALQIAAPSLARMGRFGAALDAARRGHAVARALSRPTEWYPWVHTFFRSQTLALAGSFSEAERLAKAEHAAALDSGSIEAQAWFAWGIATTLRGLGDVEGSIRYCREAVALFSELGRTLVQRESLMDLAYALALAGRAEESRSTLSALDALGLPPAYLTGVDLPIARAWVSVASDDLSRARRWLGEAAATGERIGDVVGAATATYDLVRLGPATEELLGDLERLSSGIEGEYAQARVAHARGVVRADCAELEAVSGRFELCGAMPLAAESAADAARIARTRGQARQATALEFRRAALLRGCDGATLLTHRGGGHRELLTSAEQEAALLAAAGRSNRSIADELCLSVRSVEGRLQRVYAKLGVTNRVELREKLHTAQ